ncbi:MAG: hypothetical protein ACYCU7_15795 [Acidimicrobiales bacterium]
MSVEQPHSLVDRPELAVTLGLAAVAVVREVADEDFPVADGHREWPLANLVEPGVEVLLLQAERSLSVSVPAAVVVPRVEDLVPGEVADERLVSSRRPIATSPRTWTVSCGPTTEFQFDDEHGVHLADIVERPVAVADDVPVIEVLVRGEVGRHGSVFAGAGSGVGESRPERVDEPVYLAVD